MKKIISLVIFIVVMVWTWNVIHTTPAIGFETHSGIQARLADLIRHTLAEKKPQAKDLTITRLWTEAINDNKVRAVFAYKFIEPSENGDAEQTIEGEAVLHREPSENNSVDKWTLQSVKTTNDTVTFSEGSVITPGDDNPAAETAPVETEQQPEDEK